MVDKTSFTTEEWGRLEPDGGQYGHYRGRSERGLGPPEGRHGRRLGPRPGPPERAGQSTRESHRRRFSRPTGGAPRAQLCRLGSKAGSSKE